MCVVIDLELLRLDVLGAAAPLDTLPVALVGVVALIAAASGWRGRVGPPPRRGPRTPTALGDIFSATGEKTPPKARG